MHRYLSLAIVLFGSVFARAQQLPNTQPLTVQGDLAAQMVEGIDRFLMAQTVAAVQSRSALWHLDVASPEAYEKSIASHRASLAKILGVVDKRDAFGSPEFVATVEQPALMARAGNVEIFAVTIGAVKLKNFDQDEAVTFKDHWRIDDIRSTEESLHALFKKR